jgi:hypothetical protein
MADGASDFAATPPFKLEWHELDGGNAGGNESHLAKWLDLEMLMLPGGRERTEEEFGRLFQRAGFHLTRVVQTKSPVCVIEAEKRG